jgi:hypothetical protein
MTTGGIGAKEKKEPAFAPFASLRAGSMTGDSARGYEDEMRDFLRRLFENRYVGLLEAEVMRLRAENRALTNSLLGTAGFPPVEFAEAAKPQALPRLRKRSWHQIQAWRATEAARDAAVNVDERTNGSVLHS